MSTILPPVAGMAAYALSKSALQGLGRGLARDFGPELRDALFQATGARWQVEQGQGEAQPSLAEAEAARAAAAEQARFSDPLVQAALQAFPQAEWIDSDQPGSERFNKWSRSA